MKNLIDLNNILFDELERLNNGEILKEKDTLEKELLRAKAITDISNQVVSNARVMLDAKKHSDAFGNNTSDFYSANTVLKKIENNPYTEFAKESNKVTREEFKDKLLFEMDKQNIMNDE